MIIEWLRQGLDRTARRAQDTRDEAYISTIGPQLCIGKCTPRPNAEISDEEQIENTLIKRGRTSSSHNGIHPDNPSRPDHLAYVY